MMADRYERSERDRMTVWRLFEEGYLDENAATVRLLSEDLKARRRARGPRDRRQDVESLEGRPTTYVA